MQPKFQQIAQQLHHHEVRESSNSNSSDHMDQEARSLLLPTVTVVERPIPLLLDVINKDDSTSMETKEFIASTKENDFSEL